VSFRQPSGCGFVPERAGTRATVHNFERACRGWLWSEAERPRPRGRLPGAPAAWACSCRWTGALARDPARRTYGSGECYAVVANFDKAWPAEVPFGRRGSTGNDDLVAITLAVNARRAAARPAGPNGDYPKMLFGPGHGAPRTTSGASLPLPAVHRALGRRTCKDPPRAASCTWEARERRRATAKA